MKVFSRFFFFFFYFLEKIELYDWPNLILLANLVALRMVDGLKNNVVQYCIYRYFDLCEENN